MVISQIMIDYDTISETQALGFTKLNPNTFDLTGRDSLNTTC